MPSTQKSTINLGLSATPEVPDRALFVEFVRIYNAINLLAQYLDQYTGNGTVNAGHFDSVQAGTLSVTGGGSAIPAKIKASAGANALQIIGRTDGLGFIEFFRANGTTLEGSIYGSNTSLNLTGPDGNDATVINNTGVKVNKAFSCNGKSPQTAYSLPAAATDLPTALTLINSIRLALIANGIAV